jgi:hypothetical protein
MTDQLHAVVSAVYSGSEVAQKSVTELVGKSFGHYGGRRDLTIPAPQKIRAGLVGGLPFDSLTTDLFLGCLSASQICYGNCFAARAAFEAGFDYGTRVENELDEEVFHADLTALPVSQRYLKNGWNSDPSWSWPKAHQLAKLIRSAGRHTVLLTKCFTRLDDATMAGLAALRVELRVSVSAFDSRSQFEQRLRSMERYRDKGGIAVPQLFTTSFRNTELSERQHRIVDCLVDRDFPAAENSLRFNPRSPVVALVDETQCGHVDGTGDVWSGRLFADVLRIPALTAVPPSYIGLERPTLSGHTPEFVASLWLDWVATHAEVVGHHSVRKPVQCGVPMQWHTLAAMAPSPSVGR